MSKDPKVVVVALTQSQVDAIVAGRDRLVSLWHTLGKQDDELSEIVDRLRTIPDDLRWQSSPYLLEVSKLRGEDAGEA